jgi:tetratricopeptide (TPR) repeat protein
MDQGSTSKIVGDFAKSATAYREATQIAEQFDRRDSRRLFAWNSLATVYDALGRYNDAEAGYRRALRAAEESSGKSSSDYALVLGNLGAMYVETGQAARGEKLVREALAIHSAAGRPDELRIAITQNSLAEILLVSGKYREAEPLLTESLAVLEKRPNAWSETALVLNNLGVVRVYQRNYADGARLLLQSLATMEERLGPDHPMLLRTLNNVASLANRAGNREEAGEKLRRALDIAERRLGPEHPVYGGLLANYATYLRQGGEKSRARVLQARSNQILKDSSRRSGVGAVIDISAFQRK